MALIWPSIPLNRPFKGSLEGTEGPIARSLHESSETEEEVPGSDAFSASAAGDCWESGTLW